MHFDLIPTHHFYQLSGLGKIRPNTLVLGFKNNWRECPTEEVEEYVALLQWVPYYHALSPDHPQATWDSHIFNISAYYSVEDVGVAWGWD